MPVISYSLTFLELQSLIRKGREWMRCAVDLVEDLSPQSFGLVEGWPLYEELASRILVDRSALFQRIQYLLELCRTSYQ